MGSDGRSCRATPGVMFGSCHKPIRLGVKTGDTALGTFSARAACIHPDWDIPMLGEAPIGSHPPVTYRVSELERPQCIAPAGAVSLDIGNGA
jgi:hypothetical protein